MKYNTMQRLTQSITLVLVQSINKLEALTKVGTSLPKSNGIKVSSVVLIHLVAMFIASIEQPDIFVHSSSMALETRTIVASWNLNCHRLSAK
jgi:hypothetical protein